jgi:hypothetical protein
MKMVRVALPDLSKPGRLLWEAFPRGEWVDLRGRGRITVHLPEGWHREQEWMNLFEAACGPPPRAA